MALDEILYACDDVDDLEDLIFNLIASKMADV
jgi:hypothetical protein